MDLLTNYIHVSELQAISVTANLHNSHITTASAKPFPVCFVLTSRSLAMASNSGDCSPSCTQVLSSQAPYRTLSVAPVFFKISPRHGPHRDTLFPTVPLLLHVNSLLWEHVYEPLSRNFFGIFTYLTVIA
jgi:hypothetical protein